MKMKKLSLGLSVAAISAFALMLTSCEGSKKISYEDENGELHTVTVKKTSNEEEIADAVTAFVYSKANKKFKPNGIEVDASAEAKASGVQKSNNKKVTMGGSASAKVALTFGDYEKNGIDDYAAYAEVSVNAKLPTAAFASSEKSLIANDVLLLAESEADDVDYSKSSTLNGKVRLYADKDAAYLNVQKLDIPYDDIAKIKDLKPIIKDNIVGKYIKIDKESSAVVTALVPQAGSVFSYLFNMDTYAKQYYAAYTDDTTFIDTIFADAKEDSTPSEYRERVYKDLTDEEDPTNVVISSVDGNKITFKMNLAKKNPGEKDYSGKSNVQVTFDIVKKVPTAIKADVTDYAQFMMDKSLEKSDAAPFEKIKVSAAKASVSIKYSPKVSKISKKAAENATNLSAIIGLFGLGKKD